MTMLSFNCLKLPSQVCACAWLCVCAQKSENKLGCVWEYHYLDFGLVLCPLVQASCPGFFASSELRFQMYAMHTSLVLKCEFGDWAAVPEGETSPTMCAFWGDVFKEVLSGFKGRVGLILIGGRLCGRVVGRDSTISFLTQSNDGGGEGRTKNEVIQEGWRTEAPWRSLWGWLCL